MPHVSQQQEQSQKDRYLRALQKVGTLTGGCRAAKVSPHTVYQWREVDIEFVVREHQAREACADALEEVVIKRAMGRSDILAMFMLKGMRPAKYKDNSRVELTGKDGGPIDIDIDSRESLTGRIAGLAARVGMASVD